jgi:hypothetical protein
LLVTEEFALVFRREGFATETADDGPQLPRHRKSFRGTGGAGCLVMIPLPSSEVGGGTPRGGVQPRASRGICYMHDASCAMHRTSYVKRGMYGL